MRFYLYFLLIALTRSVTSQDKVEGIGKFKIGKTPISITQEIAKESGDSIHILDEYLNMDTEKFGIAEIVVNKAYPDRSPEQALFCPDVRIFQIPAYQVAGIEIKNLWLTFKGGILIGLQCDNSTDIHEALKLKYGPPVIKTVKKPIDCVYLSNGNKLQREESKYTSSWTNGKIVATETTHRFYDKNCVEDITTLVFIRDLVVMNTVTQCDLTTRAKSLVRKREAAKKALSDF
ncbi:hypothetical protein GO755_24780 [Spirosoma sp. HMF4905]|uniref:Uncharacterized protein n=1 Tax=Spirosoma arboris TaxID=2682092 RepID=A0A7K1SHI3_9BACT|nr:hypothetical protein [Spirosoma arboris]MVM33279.1 hypothetical protein [Spirosoma arboris]